MSQDERIDEGLECPDCGEVLAANLTWNGSETLITCESCGCIYFPDDDCCGDVYRSEDMSDYEQRRESM